MQDFISLRWNQNFFWSCVCFFLLHGAPVQAVTPSDIALVMAVGAKSIEGMKAALRDGANPLAVLSDGGITVLSRAIVGGHVEAVALLLDSGADPNSCPKGSDGWCPLTGALYVTSDDLDDAKREKIVKILLKAGADPDGNSSKDNPLSAALLHKHAGIVELLLEAGANPNGTPNDLAPLSVALRSKQAHIARRLILAGAKPKVEENLLVLAAQNADADAISLLLQFGQKPNSQPAGSPELAEATRRDCAECVRLLLEAGARSVLMERYAYASPTWFEIIGRAGPQVLDAYAAHGLDLKTIDQKRYTFLHNAAALGQAASVKWLVQHGAQVDALDEHHTTPLMLAAANGQLELVQALLDAKASVSLRDKWGKTAKSLAAREVKNAKLRHAEVIRLLEAYGASEYVGTKLPPSEFDGELAGKSQVDVTGSFYKQLPFLGPNLRFFVTVNRAEDEALSVHPNPGVVTASVFAVLPDHQVIKLATVNDFTKLHLRLRSKEEALQLVRVFSDPWLAIGTDLWAVNFEGMDLMELPDNTSCISVSQEPLRKAEVGNPPVVASENRGGSAFVVTRYMVPRPRFGVFVSQSLASLARATERVAFDGRYSMTTEMVSTPGLELVQRCLGL